MKKITLCRKNKINDIIQLKDQLNQQKDKLFQYIDNILENKSREYNKNTYYIHTLHNNNNNNIINDNNQEMGINENINEENSHIAEFMQKFINDHIITIEGIKYLKEKDKLRKIITTNEEKFNLMESS